MASETEAIHTLVTTIQTLGIQLVVFDFDCTAYRKHTGGVLSIPADTLLATIATMVHDMTPSFTRIVPLLLEKGIHVAIGTFGDALTNTSLGKSLRIGGEPLIRPILDGIFGSLVSSNIPIFALNP
jgi:hypothetical protein